MASTSKGLPLPFAQVIGRLFRQPLHLNDGDQGFPLLSETDEVDFEEDYSPVVKVAHSRSTKWFAAAAFLGCITVLVASQRFQIGKPPKFKTITTPSEAAVTYWKAVTTLQTESHMTLTEFARERARARDAVVQSAAEKGLVRNPRTPGSDPPVVVYWPEPESFWKSFYGTSSEEKINVPNCRVSCQLISGSRNATAQEAAHVLFDYTVLYPGRIAGLENRELLKPWQKTAMYTMEPNEHLPNHIQRVKFYDFLASYSSLAEIRLEYYIRPFCGAKFGNTCIGLGDMETRHEALSLWSQDGDENPFLYLLPEDVRNVTRFRAPRRLATFISNCNPNAARTILIKDLTKLGMQFDHYGQCKHETFGGAPADLLDIPTGNRGDHTKTAISSLYYFVLVAENNPLRDYVSEKVTEGLVAGGIPIILGSPSLAEELGNSEDNPIFVDATKFTPLELLLYMDYLYQQDLLHEFHSWKRWYPKRSPMRQYFQRTQANSYSQNNMMHPLCATCEYYHEKFDWETVSPMAF